MRSLLCVSLVLTLAQASIAQQECLKFCRADCDQAYPPGSPDNDECKELCLTNCDYDLCCTCNAASQTCDCFIGPCGNKLSTQTNLLSPMSTATLSGNPVMLSPGYSWGGVPTIMTPMAVYPPATAIVYPAPVTYSARACAASNVSHVWPTTCSAPVLQACQPRCFPRRIHVRSRRCCW